MEAVWFLIGAGTILLAILIRRRFWSFSAQEPADYAEGPSFDLKRRLNGPILCEGVIFGPTGRVSSRFVGTFHARWTGDHGVMEEAFHYDDGTTQDRAWHIRLGRNGRIEVSADDLDGTGSGTEHGPAVHLRYRLRLPEAQGGHVLDVTDWMYLAPNGTIVNRSQFRKYGVRVAELVATLRADPSGTAREKEVA